VSAEASCSGDFGWLPGFGSTGVSGYVAAFAIFDDGLGGGPALYAAGEFESVGDAAASRIAKWDGNAWSPLGSGLSSAVRALAVFDDGSGGGPELYVGGYFETAGGVPANYMAKWNGTTWSAVDDPFGFNGVVSALTVFDDGLGGGPALYAGGEFTTAGLTPANRVAKWNGAFWSKLGNGTTGGNGWVNSFATFDDGTGGGPALFVGGDFLQAGNAAANRVAKWNGTVWSGLGAGAANGVSGEVHELAVFDDGSGSGPALYAGGSFTTAGGVTANRIARWNGVAWSPLVFRGAIGVSGLVLALGAFDDGSGRGPALYVGGIFTTAGGVPANRIAKWDGTSWSSLGTGSSNGVGGLGTPGVHALTVFDDGSGGGPSLYTGGTFSTVGAMSAKGIAKWDGMSWSPLVTGTANALNGPVKSFTVFDDGLGGGPALYAGGSFTTAGEVIANRIAKWNGSTWLPLESSGTNGLNDEVNTLAVFDDGSGHGPALYAGGSFTTAGGVTANRIAKWDGTSWLPLGTGAANGVSNGVSALTVFDDGAGDGPALYAGGSFTTAGGVPANRIAKWDGTSWSPLGTGSANGVNNTVFALLAFDNGSGDGPRLYAGGVFTSAGGVTANRIAKWDGVAWSPLGTGAANGVNNTVFALAAFDSSAAGGPALYAGGSFLTAGGLPASRIARWDGSVWSPLGAGVPNGVNGTVNAIWVFDDGVGAGPALYAGGSFATASGVTANRIAKWDGTSWSSLGSGSSNGVGTTAVYALTVFDDGSGGGPALYVGGNFLTAGVVAATYIAKWGCETSR
jgi:hypothetical protein